MKYIILVGDGMSDLPLKELGGKTPLEVAKTPNMDWIAKNGITGWVNNVPPGMPPGSDVAALSIFGYNPQEFFPGRGPLEAASMGIVLLDEDVAFRCNLVNIKDNVMHSFTAGHISTPEASELILEINQKLGSDKVCFYPGVSYRHLCVIKSSLDKVPCTPPHDITDKEITPHLPGGKGSETLKGLMERSKKVLADSKINHQRIKNGKLPATQIWLWGQGKKPIFKTFKEKFNIDGSVITAVDLIKGIGVLAGLSIINVPGATGYLDTNYKGKAEYALKSLEQKDFVFVHVESPDEAGHEGSIESKIKAIQDFDKFVVGTVLENIKKFGSYRILVLPDHPTPISLKTHTSEAVPFAIFDTSESEKDAVKAYSEKAIKESKLILKEGHKLTQKILFKKA